MTTERIRVNGRDCDVPVDRTGGVTRLHLNGQWFDVGPGDIEVHEVMITEKPQETRDVPMPKEVYRGFALSFNPARPAFGPWQAHELKGDRHLHARNKPELRDLIDRTLDAGEEPPTS